MQCQALPDCATPCIAVLYHIVLCMQNIMLHACHALQYSHAVPAMMRYMTWLCADAFPRGLRCGGGPSFVARDRLCGAWQTAVRPSGSPRPSGQLCLCTHARDIPHKNILPKYTKFCAIKQADNCAVIVKSVPQHIISLNMCTNKQITQQIKQNLNRDLCLVWKTI